MATDLESFLLLIYVFAYNLQRYGFSKKHHTILKSLDLALGLTLLFVLTVLVKP